MPPIRPIRILSFLAGLLLASLACAEMRPPRPEAPPAPFGIPSQPEAPLDRRAEGTFNEHHVRGLGESGMRVWDFGWQPAVRGWRNATKVSKMRLLLHATDPQTLERRLGRTASKGCIRIPEAMNLFLDRHGVLDADYEQAAGHNPRFLTVLLPDRTPTPLAGNALVVVDSSEPR